MESEDLNKIYLTDKEIYYMIELLVNNDRKQLADCLKLATTKNDCLFLTESIKEQLFKRDINE